MAGDKITHFRNNLWTKIDYQICLLLHNHTQRWCPLLEDLCVCLIGVVKLPKHNSRVFTGWVILQLRLYKLHILCSFFQCVWLYIYNIYKPNIYISFSSKVIAKNVVLFYCSHFKTQIQHWCFLDSANDWDFYFQPKYLTF